MIPAERVVRHVVVYRDGRALIDRQTLALLSGRSVHTIRARCTVVEHRDGKALYDMEEAAAILDKLPKRNRKASHVTCVSVLT